MHFKKMVMLAAASTAMAFADATLDFGIIAPTTGSITYAGGSSPLVGTAISVDNVVGINSTPLNNNVIRNCLSCSVSFTTGGHISNIVTGPITTYLFLAGGSLTLTGTVDLNNNGIVDGADASGTLLSGIFGGIPQVVSISNTFNVAISTFNTLVHNTLASFYGLPLQPQQYAGAFNISFIGALNTTGGFRTRSMNSGDIIASTPEPVSIVLLGTAVVLCGIVFRRRFQQV